MLSREVLRYDMLGDILSTMKIVYESLLLKLSIQEADDLIRIMTWRISEELYRADLFEQVYTNIIKHVLGGAHE